MSTSALAPTAPTTLAIVLGASAWPNSPGFQASKAFTNAAQGFKDYLLDSQGFGLPEANLLDLFDVQTSASEQLEKLGTFLEERIQTLRATNQAVRDVLIYFVGHGGFAGPSADFYLMHHRANASSLRASGMDIDALAEVLREKARQTRRYLFLDCCFAAAAFRAFQGGPDQIAIAKTLDAFAVQARSRGFPGKGTVLLCSSDQKSPSLLLPDESCTMFSRALLDVFRNGDLHRPLQLSVRDLKELVEDRLAASPEKNPPRPGLHSPDQSEGDVANVPFFPNPRAEQVPNVSPSPAAPTTLPQAALPLSSIESQPSQQLLRQVITKYDVALSYAGENREYAEALAEALRRRKLTVFYDQYEKSDLWGKNLYTYLSDVYQNRAHYCVIFLSQYYASKQWTKHEREAAQARAFRENEEYILPVRLDDTKIPGIPETVAYLNWPPETAETIADALMEKLQRQPGETPAAFGVAKRGITRRATILRGMAALGTVAAGAAGLVLASSSHLHITSLPTFPSATPTLLSGTTLFTYRGHSSWIPSVAWSPDGTRIASGSGDTTVQIFDATTGDYVLTYRGHSDNINGVPWSPSGKRIASGSTDKTVQVWDAATGNHVLTYRGHLGVVRAVAWSPNGMRIASGSHDTTVQVWDGSNGRTIFTYKAHAASVTSVAWSPDGTRIVSGSDDATVQVWDASTGATILTYRGHSDAIESVTWSPDNNHIASGSHDRTAQVWSSTTGKNICIYRGHSKWIGAVAWSPDGKHVASGSDDATVQVWDASTGATILTYRGHSRDINAVGWSPDSAHVVSGSIDTTVQVWQVS